MLVPLSTPEIVMGTMLFLAFDNLFTFVPLGRTAMLLGHVTFSISYVVVIVRGRLLTIGRDIEEAAQDLGATPDAGAADGAAAAARPGHLRQPDDRLRHVDRRLRDLGVPVGRRLDGDRADQDLLDRARLPTPALNAMATAMLVGTAVALVLAVVALRVFRRGERGSAVEDFARLDI